MASVYVFNATIENMNLVLNGEPVGSIEGMSSANGYALEPMPVPQTAGSNPGQFGSQNQLIVETFQGQHVYQVQVGSSAPPGTDYQLYLFAGSAVLAWPSGAETLSAR